MNAENVQKLRDIIDLLKDANDRVKELNTERYALEAAIIEEMDSANIESARTPFGTISVNKATMASVKNWDEFEDYIYANRALYLMQRRTSAPAYRELLESGQTIPGVEPFVKSTVSLRRT